VGGGDEEAGVVEAAAVERFEDAADLGGDDEGIPGTVTKGGAEAAFGEAEAIVG